MLRSNTLIHFNCGYTYFMNYLILFLKLYNLSFVMLLYYRFKRVWGTERLKDTLWSITWCSKRMICCGFFLRDFNLRCWKSRSPFANSRSIDILKHLPKTYHLNSLIKAYITYFTINDVPFSLVHWLLFSIHYKWNFSNQYLFVNMLFNHW